MSNSSFAPNKIQPKAVRLAGTLTIHVNEEHVIKISDAFIIQTDLRYSGMSIAEQETAMHAVNTALANNADITFTAELTPEVVKTANKGPQAPSPLDQILADLNKPKPADLVEAIVRDDNAKLESTTAALDILGAEALPESFGVK